MDNYMNAYQIARQLGVSHMTVYRWAEKEGLPYHIVTVGRQTTKKFILSEVLAWIETQKKNKVE